MEPVKKTWIKTRVVGLCMLMYALTSPTNVMGIGPFTESLIREVGFERSFLSFLYFFSTCVVGLFAFLAGICHERIHLRLSFQVSNFCLFLTFFGLSFLPSKAEASELSFFVSVALLFGFCCMQWMGQGLLVIACRSSVVRLFPERLQGLWAGVQESVGTLVVTAIPFVFLWSIEHLGWRLVWRLTGCVYLSMVFVAYFTLPKKLAQSLSTNIHSPSLRKPEKILLRRKLLPWNIIKKPHFWVCNAIINLPVLISSGLFFHIESIGAELGLQAADFAKLLIPMALGIICTNLVLGALVVRAKFPLKILLALIILSQMVLVESLYFLQTRWGLCCYLIAGSAGWALFGLLMNILWMRLYGPWVLGFLMGWSVSFSLIMNAIGPLLMARVHELFGFYRNSFHVLHAMGAMLLFALCFVRLREKFVSTKNTG